VSLGSVKFSRALQVEDHTNAISMLGTITEVRAGKGKEDKEEGYI
jgi:hypothetical protein